MKTLSIIIAGLMLTGCASVQIKTPTWEMRAQSFCKKIEIPKTDVATADGTHILVEGYSSAVDVAAIKVVLDGIIKDIINAGIKAWLVK